MNRLEIYARSNNIEKDVLIFNFTRSIPKLFDTNSLYCAIENLKDGVVFSGKYESKSYCTRIPHVIIFSNILPIPHVLSFDRWDIRMITKKRHLRTLSIEDINTIIEHSWQHIKINFLDKRPPGSLDNWYLKFSPYKSLWIDKNVQYSPPDYLYDE